LTSENSSVDISLDLSVLLSFTWSTCGSRMRLLYCSYKNKNTGTLPIDNAVAVRLNPVQKTIGLAWPCIAHTPELGAHIMMEVKSPNIQQPYCMLLHFKWSSSRGRGCIMVG